MRVGLYGGSFDPIHRGHIEPVLEARDALGLDRVLYLPTASPPHKPDRRMAPALARLTMVELALLPYPDLRVSPFEILAPPPTYTVATLEHMRREAPEDDLTLLIGGDSFLSLHTWHRFEELLQLAEVGVMLRPGFDRRQLDALAGPIAGAVDAGRVHFVDNRPVDASSTELRRLLAAGDPSAARLLPAPVLSYLRKYGLYRAQTRSQ